jgi:CheY-like chemotaxis protein
MREVGRCLCCENGTALSHAGPPGLDLARQFRPAVVLLDIGLPGMDGYAVAAEMRKRPETAYAILAAVSGYGQDQDRRRSQEAGFDAHLLKPVKFDALNDVIGKSRSINEGKLGVRLQIEYPQPFSIRQYRAFLINKS